MKIILKYNNKLSFVNKSTLNKDILHKRKYIYHFFLNFALIKLLSYKNHQSNCLQHLQFLSFAHFLSTLKSLN
jgi:hypothetical protein